MVDRLLLGEGHWLHIRGGYTDTYICTKQKRVIKFCDKYYYQEPISASKSKSNTHTQSNKKYSNEDNYMIHYSSICDLVFSKALEKLKGFPKIHQYNIYDSKVRIDMDYLGKTTHDACHSYSIQTRWKLASRMIEQIALQCFNLYYNGIQHTDVKLGNVLIDDSFNFHLIDFNCMSTSVMYDSQNVKWCEGVGTYHYLAPEILFTGKPHDTSMVWSIAMITLHWLLGHYPISDERMIKYISVVPSTHSQWKKFMYELRKKYSNGMQLEKKHLEQLDSWWSRLQPMLKWNPYKRWSLTTVLQMFHTSTLSSEIRVKNINYVVDPSIIDAYSRRSVIEKAYMFLKAIQMEHVFVSSIMMFDKCYPHLNAMNMDLLYLCCWATQGYLTNRFLFDEDNIVFTIHEMYGITCDKIIAEIYKVGEVVSFDVWQKEWYIIVTDLQSKRHWILDWDLVKKLLIQKTTIYNSMSFANDYIHSMSQSESESEFKELDKVK
jgi:serine/threonine protein kinase